MRTIFIKRAAAVIAACCLVTTLSAPQAIADPGISTTGVPLPTPVTDHCPNKSVPTPAVDESEVVAAGETTPTPLAVPNPPLGGNQLGACGIVADPAVGPLPERLTSSGWLIADLDTGNVVAAKDPHGRYRPASTIKVLLALVVLDELNLDTPVEATVNDWSMEGDSCGMGPGGKYTVRDLLTGLLVVSGNDCANALARELGGLDETLAKMNATAAKLGARDTRAASPSGLDSAGMSTSPFDLALFFREAMGNETFRDIMALKTYTFPGYPKRVDVPGDVDHPAWTMGTSNPLLRDDWPGMLGGKTGYTDDALKTFVGAAQRNGRNVLIVQMYGLNEADNSYSEQAARMFEYGFAAPSNATVGSLAVPGSRQASPYDDDRDFAISNDVATAWSTWLVVGLAVFAALCLIGALVLATIRRRQR
ncbi:D-alanyl-D-alanine carboxypeptidase family protein [Gordonia sp. (in: high G+C Gram-positive bacteria)]|uniref:D-alanyl-D-alanine carboxypeptidase family protein n=1 Tax=Gordonia sp. (in: high G+C Gram-positive bacteria) TaxID=84139 RepID=UPI003C781CB7